MRRWLLGTAAAAACVVVAGLGVLAVIDGGALDRPLADVAARRLKRPVTFTALRTHLLSAHPTVTVEGLRIGPLPGMGAANLLEADRIRLTLGWPTLALRGVEVERPTVNLLRLSRERNNWSTGARGGGGDPFAGVRRLSVTDGRFIYDDRVQDLRLSGRLTHDAAPGAARPLAVTAEGVLQGGQIQLSATGGALNHRPRGAPYAFSARVQDGATVVTASGTSAQPAQLKAGFDLAVAAQGPNLANMKYLIDLGLPNSGPYRLTARLQRRGEVTRATDLKAVIGRSDFTGSIVSDGSRPRRLITADLTSQTLYAADIGDFLGHIPPHAATRSTSGSTIHRPGPLFTTAPIDLKRFRLKDARLNIAARRFVVGGVSPGRLTTVGTLDHGRFALKPFTIVFPAGRADGVLTLDLNGDKPVFGLDGAVRGAEIGALVPGLARTLTGAADLKIQAAGAGASFREVALNAKGGARLRLRGGSLQAAQAKVLSGAVIQGAVAALADKSARTELTCALVDMGLGRGRLDARRILVVTDAGTAVAAGGVDLATETLALTVYGRPSGLRLLAVKAPVSVTGPMLAPQAKVRLGGAPPDPAHPPLEAPKVVGDRAAFCRQQLGPG